MDEMTSVAIWILITLLVINTSVVWFSSTDTFIDNGLAIGVTENAKFTGEDSNALMLSFFGVEVDCSTASANPLLWGPCWLARTFVLVGEALDTLWTFGTAWVNLVNAMIPDWIPASGLFKAILIPIVFVIQFFAIFVITLRVAGIIRGGS